MTLEYNYEPTIQSEPTQPQPSKTLPGAFPTDTELVRRSTRTSKPTEKGIAMEKDKITKAINRIQNKMSKDVEEFEKRVEEIEDEQDLDAYTTQHVLRRQHNQEQLRDLQQKLNRKEFTGLSYHIPDPTSYQEAMETDEADEWKKAMDEEMEVLRNRRVGEEVDRPKNKKGLKGRWVYKAKVK